MMLILLKKKINWLINKFINIKKTNKEINEKIL